jgi:hypothetical protein
MPYNRRRIIVVTDDKTRREDTSPGWRAARTILPLVPYGVAAVMVMDLIKIRREMQRSGEDLTAISSVGAAQLRFPVGHPRKNVAYIGHPVDPAVYIPVADFHRFLFEHKVAEALRVIRSLGAVTIEVSRVEGWDQSIGVSLGAEIPRLDAVDLSASASRERKNQRMVLSTMRLTPAHPPALPPDLVWLPHEPLWQEIARARLESGLDSFVLDVRASDDYGVNTRLKALVSKVGLEAGGSYVEHRDTLWRLQGAFSPAASGHISDDACTIGSEVQGD